MAASLNARKAVIEDVSMGRNRMRVLRSDGLEVLLLQLVMPDDTKSGTGKARGKMGSPCRCEGSITEVSYRSVYPQGWFQARCRLETAWFELMRQ